MLPRSITLAAIGCGILSGAALLAQTTGAPVLLPTNDESLLVMQREAFRHRPHSQPGSGTQAGEHRTNEKDLP